ncbi:hypothetical protein, partial [Enterobacter cloacae complex sp. 4DZ1-17B1]|uniref:hypothetical protein n=1 Tax=Enterobacter cloacae complex sp. 4DZ1-17B1 TaxID=2511991 RepID=UPI001CA55FCB
MLKESPQPQTDCHKSRDNHLVKQCPHTEITEVNAYCLECGITHLIPDCPKKPNQIRKNTTNVSGIVQLPSSSENENVVPVEVVTRAQAQKKADENPETKNTESDTSPKIDEGPKTDAPSQKTKSKRNSWKSRKTRMKARR